MHVKSKVTLGACVRRAVAEDGGRLYAEVGDVDGLACPRPAFLPFPRPPCPNFRLNFSLSYLTFD
jgi:hypothetical protein